MLHGIEILPKSLRDLASLRGNEFAWPIACIPDVILEAKRLGLINVGGQLQYRLPSGTCECYWVEVNAVQNLPVNLTAAEKVDWTATEALDQFEALPEQWDFDAEGYRAFSGAFNEFVSGGGVLDDAKCFVWYLKEP